MSHTHTTCPTHIIYPTHTSHVSHTHHMSHTHITCPTHAHTHHMPDTHITCPTLTAHARHTHHMSHTHTRYMYQEVEYVATLPYRVSCSLVFRMVEAEEEYVDQLNLLVSCFLRPFKMAASSKKPPCNHEDVNSIFLNSETLLFLHQVHNIKLNAVKYILYSRYYYYIY